MKTSRISQWKKIFHILSRWLSGVWNFRSGSPVFAVSLFEGSALFRLESLLDWRSCFLFLGLYKSYLESQKTLRLSTVHFTAPQPPLSPYSTGSRFNRNEAISISPKKPLVSKKVSSQTNLQQLNQHEKTGINNSRQLFGGQLLRLLTTREKQHQQPQAGQFSLQVSYPS